MAQSVATPWGCSSLTEAWPSRLRAFLEKSLVPNRAQPPENIEKPVANWQEEISVFRPEVERICSRRIPPLLGGDLNPVSGFPFPLFSMLVCRPYLIVYRIAESQRRRTLEILRFWHGVRGTRRL